MARKRKERPDGCVIYASALRQILMLPDDSAGRIIKATAELFLEGTEPEGFELSENIVFSLFRDNVTEAFDKFHERCARNKEIADNRSSGHDALPLVTSGEAALPSAPIEENRFKKNLPEEKAAKPPRAHFVPPSLEEVRAYCQSRSSPVDPVAFYEYFETGSWKDAKGQPVRNWKQKLLTWEKHQTQHSAQQSATPAADLSWRQTRSYAAEDLIEDPPGSGHYRLREEVSADA